MDWMEMEAISNKIYVKQLALAKLWFLTMVKLSFSDQSKIIFKNFSLNLWLSFRYNLMLILNFIKFKSKSLKANW